jgi:tetratricopeptide (TPR) repeat protein
LYIAIGESDKAIESARAAVHLSPNAIRYGVLADALAKAGKNADAATAFATGSSLDPNNPAPLRRQFEFLTATEDPSAFDVARKLVAMEKSDFYSLSALPWLVPTDSIGAREFLAAKAPKAEAAELLAGAVEILRKYRSKTIPELRRLTGLQSYYESVSALQKEFGREPNQAEVAAKFGMTQNQLYDWLTERREHRIAGESIAEADEKMLKLREILAGLANIYRSSGKGSEASALEAEADGLK